jgi:hypothetical protein
LETWKQKSSLKRNSCLIQLAEHSNPRAYFRIAARIAVKRSYENARQHASHQLIFTETVCKKNTS